jgi:hypothetical protein
MIFSDEGMGLLDFREAGVVAWSWNVEKSRLQARGFYALKANQ